MEVEDIKNEIKEAVGPVMTAWEEFKQTNDARLAEIEKKGTSDALFTEKVSRIEETLTKYEGLSQKLTSAENQAKAAADAVKQIETTLNRLPGLGGPRNETEKKRLAEDWARAVFNAHAVGVPNLSVDQRKVIEAVAAEHKALNVGSDTAGGYLAPTEYVAEIIKGVTLMSPVRSIVRIRQTSGKAIQMPKRTGQFAARRVHETGTKTETTGLAYGLEEIVAPEMYALIDISNQMLEDSAFNMAAEISEESTEQFAVREGVEFISGAYGNEMEGILTNGSIAENVSGTATTIADADGQANGLLTLKHALKTAYAANASWIMNRTTIGSVRKLKDAQKNYLWMPGIAQGKPNTIDGDSYLEFPDMPSEGANVYPISYGDFRRAYTMVDRISMEMLRDPYTQATAGNIRFIFRRRVGGKVVLAEAVRKLKCSV